MDDNNILNFKHARFGMFIHWGLYAIPGGRWKGKRMDYIGEWIQSHFCIPNAEYAELAEQFNPMYFNANDWVKCAKDAGMSYIVFTAKHHDGFAMYHSRVSSYNIVEATPFGRDVLRELAYACKQHDMKLGIYYSHCLDWHDPDGADPGPDPSKNFRMPWGNNWDYQDFDKKDFSRYFRNKAMPQIRELLTEYGPVFLMWFDFSLQISNEQCTELRELVKSLQPDCLINGRIGHNMGDFGCLGDNQMPVGNTGYPLESANTLNHSWGYKKDDHNWIDAPTLIGNLLSTIEKDVNFLLNIGPRADGRFPEASLDILSELGIWRKNNKFSVQGNGPNPFPQTFSWGWCLSLGNTLQFFIKNSRREITVFGVRSNVKFCNCKFRQDGTKLCINLPLHEDELPFPVTVEFAEKPLIDQVLTLQDGVLILSPVTGEIICGTTEGKWGENVSFGPAAEVFTEDDKCFLSDDGTLTQWHHPGDGINWTLNIPEAGTYEINVITTNRLHSSPWVGNRIIKLEFAGQIIEKELKSDQMLDSAYYSSAVSRLGVIDLSMSVGETFKFTTQTITNSKAIDMNLTSIEITKKKGDRKT